VVRRLARQMGVDIASVAPTGPRGRVTKEDVERAAKGGAAAHAMAAARAVQSGTEERIPFRGLRRKIADKMHQSKSTAAHFSYVDEVDMTELVVLRASLKEEASAQGVKLTYLPFIIKALVPAFRKFPSVNSTLDETAEQMILKHYYNVGIAVDTDDGLVVPVAKRVETKSLLDLAREVAILSEKARAKRLSVDDLQGGTFTITSVGNIGGMFATPIINFPEVAILGVNRIHERPVVREGVVCIRQMMYLAISLDHRVVDGATGARFLNEVKRRLENPGLLLLDAV
jgi:pyruvate dehydrogenase E2 component (dihydrolipoamide acetyltransferase)